MFTYYNEITKRLEIRIVNDSLDTVPTGLIEIETTQKLDWEKEYIFNESTNQYEVA